MGKKNSLGIQSYTAGLLLASFMLSGISLMISARLIVYLIFIKEGGNPDSG